MHNKLDGELEEEIIEVKPEKSKTQKFKLWRNYYNASNLKEKILDLLLPFAIIFCIIIIASINNEWSNTSFLKSVLSSNDLVVNVMAILSGFNTASLSIIGTANMEMVKKETTDKIIDYFSFAIMFQLIILIVGIIIKFSSGYILDMSHTISQYLSSSFLKYLLIFLGAMWYSAVVSSILISIRSLPIISSVIKLMVKK
ncbi:hypothetical protein IA806_02395 [Listeria seeligeri]|uniref:hypothetical protein n=1 Tax=Listeria seeligeri TaxID=1640 RepID=UPI001888BDF9|nr:hypothetical protein [Listeria seeligeri]MBF2345413.1 hypothetical protein [Listeria seeligeri]